MKVVLTLSKNETLIYFTPTNPLITHGLISLHAHKENMRHIIREPLFGVSNQVWQELVCLAREDGFGLEILHHESRVNVLPM